MPDKLEIPSTLPVMVLPECALLPRALLPLHIFEQRYRVMLTDALASNRMFCVATMQEPGVRETTLGGIHPYSTAGVIRACVGKPDGTSHLMLLGIRPIELTSLEESTEETPYPQAQIRTVEAPILNQMEAETLSAELYEQAQQLPESLVPDENSKWDGALRDARERPEVMAEVIGCRILQETESQQAFLGASSTESRLRLLLGILREV